jgi:hypothetical protein
MKAAVVGLSDRGRGLEWLSLGFGLWLVANLLVGLQAIEIDGAQGLTGLEPALVRTSAVAHLMAIGAIALAAGQLLRVGIRLWFGIALVSLALLAGESVWAISAIIVSGDLRPVPSTIWVVGSIAQLVLIASVLQGLRELAAAEGAEIPLYVVAVALGVELVRVSGTTTLHDAWMARALSTMSSVVSIAFVLFAIRAASAAVRAQIWTAEPGVTSPARAADWQRTAAGLDLVGGFLIGKIAIAAAALPLALIAVLIAGPDAFFTVEGAVIPVAGAICSAGMVLGLVSCQRLPDPPDARAGFFGAALLIAACLVADIYFLSAGAPPRLPGAISSLGHLVAYAALLRSMGRIGERLGDDDVTQRARLLGWLAIAAVGGGTVAGALVQYSEDLGMSIAGPMVGAGVAFAALLPCALLARQLATRLRRRFAEPPRARASFLHTS